MGGSSQAETRLKKAVIAALEYHELTPCPKESERMLMRVLREALRGHPEGLDEGRIPRR